jgi:hypothetical protein
MTGLATCRWNQLVLRCRRVGTGRAGRIGDVIIASPG